MTHVTTADGTRIFYKDWGTGRPVVLSHGWPLNSDSWEAQHPSSRSTATALSPTTAAATAGPRRPGTATTWTPTPTTSPLSWTTWTSRR